VHVLLAFFTDHNGEKFKLLFTFSLDLFGVASRWQPRFSGLFHFYSFYFYPQGQDGKNPAQVIT
jgi:hypothetical protein